MAVKFDLLVWVKTRWRMHEKKGMRTIFGIKKEEVTRRMTELHNEVFVWWWTVWGELRWSPPFDITSWNVLWCGLRNYATLSRLELDCSKMAMWQPRQTHLLSVWHWSLKHFTFTCPKRGHHCCFILSTNKIWFPSCIALITLKHRVRLHFTQGLQCQHC